MIKHKKELCISEKQTHESMLKMDADKQLSEWTGRQTHNREEGALLILVRVTIALNTKIKATWEEEG